VSVWQWLAGGSIEDDPVKQDGSRLLAGCCLQRQQAEDEKKEE
jgi:hypothetical protein